MEKKITAMRNESEAKIQAIEAKKASIAQELTQVKSTLSDTTAKLDDAHSTIAQQDQTITQKEQTIAQQEQEKGALAAKLESDKERYAKELSDLEAQHNRQLESERATFMANLKKQKLSAEARARKIAKFAADAEAKAGALEGQLSGLQNKIADTDNQLRGAQAEYEAAKQKLEGTQQALAGTQQALAGTQDALAKTEGDKARALAAVGELQGDLAKTRAIANARKILAKQIADEFAKAGIKGAVDGKTGEVTLDFGGEYFETGSTSLKPNMRQTLDKFIPTYAKSLFSNPKLADKIGNIEIVGFASSTYQGRYVNPKSTKANDKAAIEYNLKLSFGRANSIFNHVLNSKTLRKEDREKLMPLMKVVGRGYLPDGVSASDLPDSMSDTEFCEKYNCKKAQRVVVKFNMKD
jgi:outer membrane protein OmpA-like peptidoglycan-associated protein